MKSSAVLVVAFIAMLTACTDPGPSNAGDVIIKNARVYTLDDQQPWAEAVVVRGADIIYVGSNAGANDYVGRDTRQINAAGQMLLPGFIDTHTHPVAGGAYANALSLDTYGDVEDWVAAIADYAADNTEAEVLFGYGFLATTFGPVGPTRQLIDAVVDDRPVLIMDEGFHAAWANSAALEALNITQDTPDPMPGYSYYKRDANGDATGYLLEGTATLAMDELDVITIDVVTEGTARVIELMNAYGVTSAFDAGAFDDMQTVATVLSTLESRGDLSLRIVGSSRPETADQAGSAVSVAAEWSEQVRGSRYHYNTLKIPYDGTVEGRTAAMFEDYQGEVGNAGETVFSETQMIAMVTEAASRNMDVHVHALGERAVHETLNAIEVAQLSEPDSATRYTICHIQVVTDEDVPRFAELNVVAQSAPLWASYDTYGEQFVSADQFNRYWRFNSIGEAGARLTFGSDFPASGAGVLGMSPVLQIEIGHTRQDAGERDAPVQPAEGERLSVAQLIRGFTLDAAYQLRMEDRIGSIVAGKAADLVLLDQNLFDVDAYDLHKTEVVMTLLDGKVIYERGGQRAN